MIGADEVREARRRIGDRVRRTPVLHLPAGALPGLEVAVALKLECLQETGSFKLRGALNRILAAEVPAAGVVAASGGNHGAAVAAAARRLGHRARIFVPRISPEAKVARIRGYGAEAIVGGATYAEARTAAEAWAAEAGALDVPAFDHPLVVAGQGTAALELAEEVELDALLCGVGGGGLAAGCATALAPQGARVIGVETTGCACWHAALAAGAPVDVEVSGLAADSLGARRIGAVPFELLRAAGAGSAVVQDGDVRAAQRALWEGFRLAAEPGGAAALAALLSGAWRPQAGERLGVVVSGANLDPATLGPLP